MVLSFLSFPSISLRLPSSFFPPSHSKYGYGHLPPPHGPKPPLRNSLLRRRRDRPSHGRNNGTLMRHRSWVLRWGLRNSGDTYCCHCNRPRRLSYSRDAYSRDGCGSGDCANDCLGLSDGCDRRLNGGRYGTLRDDCRCSGFSLCCCSYG
jgi:hypothetical protein